MAVFKKLRGRVGGQRPEAEADARLPARKRNGADDPERIGEDACATMLSIDEAVQRIAEARLEFFPAAPENAAHRPETRQAV